MNAIINGSQALLLTQLITKSVQELPHSLPPPEQLALQWNNSKVKYKV